MLEIRHIPYGLDDPYLPLNGVERSPADPLENDEVILQFKTKPMDAGQRAWVEYSFNDTEIIRKRAQYQYPENGYAIWTVQIPAGIAGDSVKYRFITGQSTRNSETSEWFYYKVKKWIETDKEIYFSETPLNLVKIEQLSDNMCLYDKKIVLNKSKDERYFGLGEHYDSLSLMNGERYNYVFDQYKVQDKRGYSPAPFIFSDKGNGIFIDSGHKMKFAFYDEKIEIYIFSYNNNEKNIQIKIWNNTVPEKIISDYYKIVKPEIPPLWAFGPWMSANEWNNQEKVEKAFEKTVELDIPATVLVIEAWSDEQTFYIFNGAEYPLKENNEPFKMDDFIFNKPWNDPAGMVKKLKEKNIRTVLWQIPVLKYYETPENRHRQDIETAEKNNYVVRKKDGTFYKIPSGRWFENSTVIDFFNEEAAEWWKEKRRYLIEEIGISGFKTDGGEHLWGRDLFENNIDTAEMRNKYPEKYFNTERSLMGEDGLLFSRSGYTRTPSSSIFWVGDEDSEFEALRANITAGLNVSLSANPVWGWDIAGFSGDLPEPDLYKRAVELAVFTPIFQFHSERAGDPQPSAERSPWNMAEFWQDETIIDHYKKYASLRMTLSPYIYEQAIECTKDGIPLTNSLAVMDKKFDNELNYMFGKDIFVYPLVDKKIPDEEIYLPDGNWISLWNGKKYKDKAGIAEFGNNHPVFVKENSKLPLSLPEDKKLYSVNHSQMKNAVLIVKKYDNENIEELKKLNNVENIGFIEEESENGVLKTKWF